MAQDISKVHSLFCTLREVEYHSPVKGLAIVSVERLAVGFLKRSVLTAEIIPREIVHLTRLLVIHSRYVIVVTAETPVVGVLVRIDSGSYPVISHGRRTYAYERLKRLAVHFLFCKFSPLAG